MLYLVILRTYSDSENCEKFIARIVKTNDKNQISPWFEGFLWEVVRITPINEVRKLDLDKVLENM